MFVPSAIAPVFLMKMWGPCSLSIRFLEYFVFWRLRCNLCDRACIQNSGAISSTGIVCCSPRCHFRDRVRIWAFAYRFRDRDRILSAWERFLRQGSLFKWLHGVSSASVTFWARWSVVRFLSNSQIFFRFRLRWAFGGALCLWILENFVTSC